MTASNDTTAERERRLHELLAEWLDQPDFDRAWLLAEHPELAGELQAFFAAEDHTSRLIGPLRSPMGAIAAARQAAEPSLVGRVVGDYELLSELGRGGMAVVYRARHRQLGREVALKRLLPGSWGSPDEQRRFRKEGRLVAALDHPHIVPIYEIGESDGLPYLAIKWIDGGSLAERPSATTPAARREVAQLVATIARAVHYAHERGVIHRDLKPSNILVDRTGRPYVADFGLARAVVGDASLTATGELVGTPSYMAPEQAAGTGTTHAVDVYGLGAVLYALLAGRPPCRAATLFETLRQVRECDPEPPPGDAALVAICLHCLAKEPRQRYATAAEVADELERWLEGKRLRIRVPGRFLRLGRRLHRRRLLGLAGLLVLGLGVSWVVRQRRPQREDESSTPGAARERLSRYALDIRQAQEAWRGGDLVEMRRRLDDWLPRDGHEDIRGFEWYYLNTQCRDEGRLLWRHEGDVHALALAPDGRLLASASKDGTVRLGDPDTGQVHPPLAHPNEVNWVAFSGDGSRLATACDDGHLRLWEVAHGRLLTEWPAHEGEAIGVEFTRGGRQLVSVGREDGRVLLWDAAGGGAPTVVGQQAARIETLALSPDGRTVATGGSGEVELALWDLKSCELRWERRLGGTVHSVGFSHGGRWLAVGCADHTVRAFDVDDKVEFRQLRTHVRNVQAVRPHMGSAGYWLSTGDDGSTRVWDMRSFTLQQVLQGDRGGNWTVCWGPGAQSILVGARNGDVRRWAYRPALGFRWHIGAREHGEGAWVFSPDGRLTVALRMQPPHLYETQTVQLHAKLDLGGEESAAFAFAPDTPRLAGLTPRGVLTLWELPSGKLVARHQLGNGDWRPFLAWGDGGRVVMVDPEGLVFWDVEQVKKVAQLPLDPDVPTGWVLSPDGRTLAVGVSDGCLLVDVPTATVRRRLTLDRNGNLADLSADGRWLATVEDHRANLWDTTTGRPGASLLGHLGRITAARFTPDGRTLATASHDGTVRLWNVATGQEMVVLEGACGRVEGVAFLAKGRGMITLTTTQEGLREVGVWWVETE